MKNDNKSMYTCITTSKVNIKQHEESMKIKSGHCADINVLFKLTEFRLNITQLITFIEELGYS